MTPTFPILSMHFMLTSILPYFLWTSIFNITFPLLTTILSNWLIPNGLQKIHEISYEATINFTKVSLK